MGNMSIKLTNASLVFFPQSSHCRDDFPPPPLFTLRSDNQIKVNPSHPRGSWRKRREKNEEGVHWLEKGRNSFSFLLIYFWTLTWRFGTWGHIGSCCLETAWLQFNHNFPLRTFSLSPSSPAALRILSTRVDTHHNFSLVPQILSCLSLL